MTTTPLIPFPRSAASATKTAALLRDLVRTFKENELRKINQTQEVLSDGVRQEVWLYDLTAGGHAWFDLKNGDFQIYRWNILTDRGNTETGEFERVG